MATFPYKWNVDQKRYEWVGGFKDGQTAGEAALLAVTLEYVNSQGVGLITIGERYMSGDISLIEFQAQAGAVLAGIHTGAALIGAGGPDGMNPADWRAVEKLVSEQLNQGMDPETGKRYGLLFLAGSMAIGEVSPAKLRQRLGMYARSGRITADAMQARKRRDAGQIYAVRHLGATDHHCAECVLYSKYPPQLIENIIFPTRRCRCGTNCKCNLEFMTEQEAKRRRRSKTNWVLPKAGTRLDGWLTPVA